MGTSRQHAKAWTAIVCAVCACSSPAGMESQRVELAVDRPSYEPGDRVHVTLTNHGPSAIGPGNVAGTLLCAVIGEQRLDNAWVEIGLLPGTCILPELPPLGVEASVTRSFLVSEPPLEDEAGTYRLRVDVVVSDFMMPLSVWSEPFTIASG